MASVALYGFSALSHSLNGSDDLIDLPRPALESRDYLDIIERCSLAERYLESNLSVVLELGLNGRNSLPVKVGPRQNDVKAVNRPVFILHFHAADANDCEHRDQELMFVVDVELAEGENVVVPSFVSFYSINYQIDEGRVYFGLNEAGFKFLPSTLGVDRKFGAAVESVGTKVSDSSTPNDIESGMQIVNCIADNKRNVRAESAVSKSVVKELFPRLTIHVQHGAVSVGRGAESLLDIRDVLIGPFDF
jgi:hypothetical protein